MHPKKKILRRRGYISDMPSNLRNGSTISSSSLTSDECTEEVNNERRKRLKQLNISRQSLQRSNHSPMTTMSTAANLSRNSTKRSLSESSAEELTRSSGTTNRSSCSRKMWRNELVMNSGSTTKQPQCKNNVTEDVRSNVISDTIDVAIRIALTILFIKLETTSAFKRKIQPEEMWLYKNPRIPDIVSPVTLIIAVIFCPFGITLLHLLMTRDRRDFRAASWVWTLVLGLNGLATSLLKISIGRPRPDFYYRCFPDGVFVLNNVTDLIAPIGSVDFYNCTGNVHDINEGRKSFPSGHASFAFASFGFISFYVSAKLHAFNTRGRGQSWRLCIAVAPLVLATLVSVSRTCDYHHHWQDVLVGGVIGLCISYSIYRQYYPSIFARNCHRPFPRSQQKYANVGAHRHCLSNSNCGDADTATAYTNIDSDVDMYAVSPDERDALLSDDKKDNKWI